MILLHGKSLKGAEKIGRRWSIMPTSGLYFPGIGIYDNLADKAKKLGIPVW